jgi:hypothetical protein
MAATTKKLDYGSVPPRATSSRAIRNEVVPSNGQTFNMNNTIIFDLPSNLNNTFWDAQSSYISFNIKNANGTAANTARFETGGAISLLRRVSMEIGGQTLCNIENYNTLYQMMFDLDTASQFRTNAGKVLFGAGDTFIGDSLAGNNGERKVCFPLVLTPVWGASKYFPLISRDRLRIRLDLDTAARAFIAGVTNTLGDSDIEITDVKLVTYSLELGSEIMSAVVAASGGSFKMSMPNYQNHQSTIAAGESSLVSTVGFSVSSLNRILVAHQLQTVTDTRATIGNRSRCSLERFNFSCGGVKFPQRDIIEKGDGSEVLAEALISQRALTTWGHQSSVASGGATTLGANFALDEPTGAAAATTGKYLIDLDLESQRVAGGESGSQLVAGLNTIGQVCQAEFTYNGGLTNAHIVNIFAEYTMLVMLDLNTLTFSIAV